MSNSVWMLLGSLIAALTLRVIYLAFHFTDLERLWGDFERRQIRFQLARLVRYLTFAAFIAAAVWCFWKIETKGIGFYGKIFVLWFGWSLLARLPVHRFPRTNRPGAYQEAQLHLFVHLVMSFLGAAAATALIGAVLWIRG
jgi:hypothetical protein